jgi:ABC-2 type transport system permease protein
VDTYVRGAGLRKVLIPSVLRDVSDVLRARMVAGRLDPSTRARFDEPARFERFEISASGTVSLEENERTKLLSFFGPAGTLTLLVMSIYLSSTYLLQSLAVERRNRVIEALLSSVKPFELLGGKVLGLGGACLLQASLFAGSFGIPLMISSGGRWRRLVLSLLYVLLGYLLYSGLLVATGIMADSEQEAGVVATMWLFVCLSPAAVLLIGSSGFDGPFARILSYFPLSAPVTMLMRISYGNPPTLDLVVSCLFLLLGSYLTLMAASKIFRTGCLLYGKHLTLIEVVRWLREA